VLLMLKTAWEPKTDIPKEEILATSNDVLSRPDIPINAREEIFRINVAGLDWDIGGKVYEPKDPSQIVVGADGKKAGCFLIHGGAGDHRSTEPMALLLSQKFGYKVATISYPGNLYLLDESRDWPGDTINPDGTVRTPIWNVDHPITPDQYELVKERSNPQDRARWGTLHFLKPKEGSDFYYRMASWPWAQEEAMKEICRRNFPVGEYSIYSHGHSTGGPFAHITLQRIENVAGLIGCETSSFGRFYSKMTNQEWRYPFTHFMVRTWRDVARYAGPEAGPDGMWRLPWLMEDVLEEWERRKHMPGIKAQYMLHFGAQEQLGEAARVTAKRLGYNAQETEALEKQFKDYAVPLEGPGVKPLPPLLLSYAIGSRDHKIELYRDIVVPTLLEVKPPPKVSLTLFHAGVHGYMKPEEGLPKGIGPAVSQFWNDAITGGFYVV
jgi:hypothetical protein